MVALAGVVVLAVIGSLLTARGGRLPGGDASGPASVSGAAPVAEARASSALSPAEAGHAVDGDPATAWVEGAEGLGEGEWLELRLARAVLVRRLIVWNGHQHDDAFTRRNRVAGLRLELGREAFSVELLDSRGGQAVELPRPVRAERIRLVVVSVHAGEAGAETALSEVEVYGTPAD